MDQLTLITGSGDFDFGVDCLPFSIIFLISLYLGLSSTITGLASQTLVKTLPPEEAHRFETSGLGHFSIFVWKWSPQRFSSPKGLFLNFLFDLPCNTGVRCSSGFLLA